MWKKTKRSKDLPKANGRWWPGDENRLLRWYGDGCPMEWIANELGRTIRAVQTHASTLGATWKGKRKRKPKGDPQSSLPLSAGPLTRIEKAAGLHPAIKNQVPDQPADILELRRMHLAKCDFFLVDMTGTAPAEGFKTIHDMNESLAVYEADDGLVPMKRLPLAMMAQDD